MSHLSADDRLAIHEILATYCHALDLGRWEEFAGLFTDDCRLDFGSLMGVYEGREGVRRFSERIQSLGLFMRHYTTNVVVRGDGERAREAGCDGYLSKPCRPKTIREAVARFLAGR